MLGCACCPGLRPMPRSTPACPAIGSVRRGPSSVLWATFAIIAAQIRGGQRFEERQPCLNRRLGMLR